MPSTTEVKPFILLPVKDGDIGVEKEFRQEEREIHKHSFIHRALQTLTHHPKETKNGVVEDENDYSEELQKFIAESSANLRYVEETGPLGSSDDETSDEDAEIVFISLVEELSVFSASKVSISSGKTEEYVMPPVQVPRSYRSQDRQGGVLVAGERVLFTHWAFKRQLRQVGGLCPLPERGESAIYESTCMSSLVEDEEVSVGFYAGKIVEL